MVYCVLQTLKESDQLCNRKTFLVENAQCTALSNNDDGPGGFILSEAEETHDGCVLDETRDTSSFVKGLIVFPLNSLVLMRLSEATLSENTCLLHIPKFSIEIFPFFTLCSLLFDVYFLLR